MRALFGLLILVSIVIGVYPIVQMILIEMEPQIPSYILTIAGQRAIIRLGSI